jgi:type I restriction enzyme S subunit
MNGINLPDGWYITTLENIATWGSGGTPSRKELAYYTGNIPWIKTGDLGPRELYNSSEFISELAVQNSSAKYFPKGSVAIAMYGATIGKTSILGIDATTNQACGVGNPIEGVTFSEFLYYFLLNEKDNFIAKGKGGAQPNISQALIKQHECALPPVAEQKVIADKLDTLLAQVETTKARLDRIPQILKTFRQSVLAGAVSGKLTEEWRDGKALDAKADLEYELSFNDNKKRKIEATSSHELVRDNFLRSWATSKFDELYRFIDYRGKTPKKSKSGKRLYTAKNIKMGYLSNEPIEYLSEEDYESWMTRGFSKINDIFFVTEGHTMGCVAMNAIGSDIALAQRTLTLQPYGNVSAKFHYYFMLSNDFQKLVDLNATGSAAKGIKASKFRGLPLPFPTYEEQTEIVRRVDELFTFANGIEKKANAALERVNSLTQSILAKAFRGELTTDWRTDNPDLISDKNSAEALLAKIKAEREAKSPKKKVKTKKAKA